MTSTEQFEADTLVLQELARTGSEQLPEVTNAFVESHRELAAADTDAVIERAVAHYNKGELYAAEQICRLVLHSVGPEIRSLHLLATVARQLGHFEDAVEILLACLDINPNLVFIRFDLAQAFFRSGRFQLALDTCNEILKQAPDNIDCATLKAGAQVKLGQYDEALVEYEKILRRAPNDVPVLLRYGIALRIVGRTDEAIEAFKSVRTLDASNGEAYWNLANLKTYKFDEDDVVAMQTALASEEVDAANRSFFEFSLGKALEDLGRFDDAFQHYVEGNKLTVGYKRYDPNRTTELVDRSIATFTQPYFGNIKNPLDARDPIFIVGLPRSGSTLLEQILSMHSAVDATMELSEVPAMVRSLSNPNRTGLETHYPEVMGNLAADELQRLGEEYLKRTRGFRGASPYFVDKTPQNFLYIGLIASILPNAKIIDARRNPYASAMSIFKQHFAVGTEFASRLEHIGQYYRDYIRLIDHWNEVLPGKVLTVQYEDIVGNTEHEVRRMLEHCDLQFEAGCLEFYKSKRAVATVSSEQVRQPVYDASLEHWKNYESFLAPLAGALENRTT